MARVAFIGSRKPTKHLSPYHPFSKDEMLRLSIMISIIWSITGCGTILTTTFDEKRIAINNDGTRNACSTIPRVYSGVAYNICKMRDGYTMRNFYELPFHVVDTVLSGGTDTVMLPYTLFTQSTQGSIMVQ